VKILIVHDREEVAVELGRIALETAGKGATAKCVRDVFSARDQLRSDYHDLIVVDLTLPILHGKTEPSLQNTQLLLNEIFEGGEAKAPGDVLGISLDTEMLKLVRNDIGEHMMACIHEDREGAWRAVFAAKIKYLIRARTARQAVANSSHDVDVVIVTALDKEAKPYEDLFGLTASDEFERAKQFTFDDMSGTMRRGVLYSIGNAGQASCGAATQALLTQFRPRLAVMTGFCGGVRKRVKLGDVLAFRSSAPWDFGKWEEAGAGDFKKTVFKPRATAINVPERRVREAIRDIIDQENWPDTEALEALAKSAGRQMTPKLRLQGCGSGSAVVTSVETLDKIVALDETIWGVDMESYAFYYACRHTPVLSPDFICIKAVADHCNGSKSSRLHGACSELSARLARHVIRRTYAF